MSFENTALNFFEKADLAESGSSLINGDALELIPTLKDTFDLVFIDANKDDYPLYYESDIDQRWLPGDISLQTMFFGEERYLMIGETDQHYQDNQKI